MARQTSPESVSRQTREERARGRRAPWIGALALMGVVTACSVFDTNNAPTPAPIIFNTPTPTATGPTPTPIPFLTETSTVTDTGTPTASATPAPSQTPGMTETPSATPAPAQTETPAITPAPTQTSAPTSAPTAAATPAGQRYTRLAEVERSGSYTFVDYRNASGREWYLRAGEVAIAECLIYDPSSSTTDMWYRLFSPGGYHGETLYAPASAFWNWNPQGPPGQHNAYDPRLAICPDSPSQTLPGP